jgi:hypothetical protein
MAATRSLSLLLAIPAVLSAARAEISLVTGDSAANQQLTIQGAPAGIRIQFVDGVRTIGVVIVNADGTAHLNTSQLASGPHSIRAVEWGTGKRLAELLHFTIPARSPDKLASRASYPMGNELVVVATGDLTGDGFADLILGASDGIRVMRNQAGTFSSPVNLASLPEPTGITVADFNGDGTNDLAIALADGRVAILLNQGGGEFSAPRYLTAGAKPSAIVSADFNGDGIPDLAVANRDSNDVSLLIGKGDGSFREAVTIGAGSSPRAMVVADFNADGVADLATANFTGNDVSILLGDGRGGFRRAINFAVGNGPVSLATADFEENGRADLAVLNQVDRNVVVLLNDGSAAFRNVASINEVTSLVVADVDGDGHVDLVLQSAGQVAGEVHVRPGRGDGTFETGYSPLIGAPRVTLALGDFNHSGRQDLAVIGPGRLTVLSGATPASAASPLALTATTTSLANSPNPAVFGQNVTLTASVSPASATGTVMFYDNSAFLGTGVVNSGTATYTTGLPVGQHSLVAYYSGDKTYASSYSQFVTQQVLAFTTTTLTSSVNPSAFGQNVTLTATVSPSFATGSVTFFDGTTLLGSRTLAGGKAAISTLLLTYGTRAIRAVYSGDSLDAPATSAVVAQRVGAAGAPANGFRALMTFPASTSYGYPYSVVVGDFNGDGKADLAVSDDNSGVNVLLGNGNGSFQPPVHYAVNYEPTYMALGDFNGDGKADLAVAYYDGVAILLGNGDGTFQAAKFFNAGYNPSGIVVGDFNGDGRADIAVANGYYNGTVSVLLGNGDGTFQPATNSMVTNGAQGIVMGDFNGDGKVDLAVGTYNYNSYAGVSVLLGNGDGTFAPATTYGFSYPYYPSIDGVVVGDFNGDGIADIAFSAYDTGSLYLLLGNGDGTFGSPLTINTPEPLTTLVVCDFNGDGKLDLAGTYDDYYSSSYGAIVLLGNGDGTFPTTLAYPMTVTPYSFATGDFNGDGRADFAIANYSAGTSSVNILLGAYATQLKFTAQPVTAVAGASVAVAVQVQDANGNLVVTQNASVTLSSAAAGINMTAASVNGVATFNVSANIVGSYTLTATSSGLTGATSNSFSITAAPANKLVFVTQPSDGATGTLMIPVLVQVQDTYGNALTSSNAPVTVGSIPSGPSATVNAQSGVATINSLIFYTPGTYTLFASSSGLTSALSNPFNIVQVLPAVAIDTPAAGTQLASGNVVLTGWALDNSAVSGSAIRSVKVSVDGTFAGNATYGISRPDVCTLYPGRPGCPNVGYSFQLNLSTGPHTILVVATDSDSTPDSASAGVSVTVRMVSTRVGVFRNNAAFLEDTNGSQAYEAGIDRFIPTFTGPGGFLSGDIPVAGDWTGDGKAKVGIYRSTTGQWFLDANNNGILDAGDFTYGFGGVAGDTPVVGDWLGQSKACVGVFRQGFFWVLDLNCNGSFDSTLDAAFPFGGIAGDVPVVGSWMGGATRVGVVRKYAPGGVPQGNPFYWVLDSGAANAGSAPANHQPGFSFAFGGLTGDVFVSGDWYNTGTSTAGVYRTGLWVLDAAPPSAAQPFHVPGLTFGYGGVPGDLPVTGKW